MRLLLSFCLLLLPNVVLAENPKCYLLNSTENRTDFLMNFTDKETYYILNKKTKQYLLVNSVSCFSELDYPTPQYECVVTNQPMNNLKY